ncbi:Uncharacterized protein TCM_032209 [Theobroma cacao]|uniref:Uncharacterized protein n=1 Tax=Theobroma cacao TaxID=3641 RepID=A0A061F998_THECC|nr:Uncharacterized protein TCM_032209 [Theobroma cacao]
MIQVQVVNNAKFSAKGQTLGSQAIRIASQMLFTLTIPSMQRDSNSDHFPIAELQVAVATCHLVFSSSTTNSAFHQPNKDHFSNSSLGFSGYPHYLSKATQGVAAEGRSKNLLFLLL